MTCRCFSWAANIHPRVVSSWGGKLHTFAEQLYRYIVVCEEHVVHSFTDDEDVVGDKVTLEGDVSLGERSITTTPL